jgi:hypothetical protein
MTAHNKVLSFLKDIKDVSLGYRQIRFFNTKNLKEMQIGYSIDEDGNSLVAEKTGYEWEDEHSTNTWKKGWIVIGSDELGDPIIVDKSSPLLPVIHAPHGCGDWDANYIIADSVENFKTILESLYEISKNREYPTLLEENPISEREKRAFLLRIYQQNPNIEYLGFWELIVGNIEDDK